MPEEHPLITRQLFSSSTLTTALEGTCAIRLYELGTPFCYIWQMYSESYTKVYYTKFVKWYAINYNSCRLIDVYKKSPYDNMTYHKRIFICIAYGFQLGFKKVLDPKAVTGEL